MKHATFTTFWSENKQDLINLLTTLKNDICDDYRASDEDTAPSMQVTISINKDCTDWSYQTGDNSYSGGCYSDPYWGVSTLYKESNPADVAKYLLSDLSQQIDFIYED